MSDVVFRGLAVVVALGLGSASVAAPAPKAISGPQIVNVELEHKQLRLLSSSLQQATAEPGGLEILATSPPDWFALGFLPGDVILAENGSPVGERMYVADGTHVFDVLRNKRLILIRVVIHPPTRRTRMIDEERYDKLLEHAKDATDIRVVPLKNAAGPSGVRVVDTLLGLFLETEVGDIIRTFDGQPIVTDAQLTAAIENMRIGNTDVVVERGARTVTLTLVRKAPLDLTQIKKLAPTRYEVTRKFADAVFADTDILSRKATVAPRIKNGRPAGFTIYDIQPEAPAAKLGFLDGDVVLDVDGHRIDSIEQVIDARSELESATALVVHIERKGKPVTLSYSVAP